MKYNTGNRPIVCMQTQSVCYKGTRPMTVRGVLWHSTGANNPNLARYVQPSDNAPDRDRMLQVIGVNRYKNDINHTTRQMGVNAWIGKLASGEIAAIQAMPWEYKPWGCGNGSRGSCNEGWIQFEICEDDLTSRDYALAVYREACELTAYLCRMFGIDPRGTVRFSGVAVPTIIDHRGSCQLGLGSNHADTAHWFPIYGKSMASAREDVARLLDEDDRPVNMPQSDTSTASTLGSRLLRKGMTGDDVAELQRHLVTLGYDLGSSGADGDFGPRTEAAVRAFQQKAGLAVDGLYGAKSHAALMAAVTGEHKPKVQVTADTPVRAGNGEQFAALQLAKAGSSFEHVATSANGWQAIVLTDRVGWVAGENCKVIIE